MFGGSANDNFHERLYICFVILKGLTFYQNSSEDHTPKITCSSQITLALALERVQSTV